MRISPNTTIEELMHTDADGSEEELMHWKYVKKEKVNGKWKYWYDWDSVKADATTKATENASKSIDKTLEVANKASKGLDTLVNKAKGVINKLYDDPNNMYDVTSASYNQKKAKIEQTDEWKDIVKRGDSEYVKKNADGSTSYLIDDYIVKKKHPVLDVMSDIISGRKVGINEITKESTVAGLKDHAISYIRTGMMAAGVLSTFLTEKFKLQQGSYDDEIRELTRTAEQGADYVKNIVDSTAQVSTDDMKKVVKATQSASTGNVVEAAKIVADTEMVRKAFESDESYKLAKEALDNVSKEDIEKATAAIAKGKMVAEASRSINEGNVIRAAQIMLGSDMAKETLGDNEYYKQTERVLSSLSEEEIAALNLLLKQARKK